MVVLRLPMLMSWVLWTMGDVIKFPGRNDPEDEVLDEASPTTDLLRHCILIAYLQDEINTEILEHLVGVLDAVDKLLEETTDD